MKPVRPAGLSRFVPSGWVWLALGLTLFKLWLTRAQSFYALAPAIHDDRLFIDLAASLIRGEWLGAYTELTLAKGPFYSLWIAGMHFAGIPLGLSQQLAYAGACALIVVALGPLLLRPASKVAAYLLLLWNPMSFEGPNLTRILRQGIYTPLGLIVFASLIALYVRREKNIRQNLPWALGGGLALGCFWLTREESIWIVPSVVLLAAALFVGLPLKLSRWLRPASLLAVTCLAAYLPVFTVSWLNYQHYGWFGTVEFRAKAFEDAYGALQRIKAGPELPGIPVTKQAREAAYKVSPMFAQLRSRFEGELGERWSYKEGGFTAADRQIAGGWFVWALREAVQKAGFAADAPSALSFYRYMADEINAACDDGRIPAGPRRSGFFPKWNPAYTQNIAPTFLKYADYFGTFKEATAKLSPSIGEENDLRYFRDIIGDRITPSLAKPDFSHPHQQSLDRTKLEILEAIATYGRQALTWLIAAAHLVWFARLGQILRRRIFSYPLFLASIAWAGAAAYLTVNALVDVTSYPNISPSAMAAAYPLLLLFVIAVAVDAFGAWSVSEKTDGTRFAKNEPWIWAAASVVAVFILSPVHQSWIETASHALFAAVTVHWLRGSLGFLTAFSLALITVASAVWLPGTTALMCVAMTLGLLHLRGMLGQTAGTKMWWLAFGAGVIAVIASPLAWSLPLAAGLAILWLRLEGSRLRFLPLLLGFLGLAVCLWQASPPESPAFLPIFLALWERNLRWPADLPTTGLMIYLPFFIHALFLRGRKDAPVFDRIIFALGLGVIALSGTVAWQHAGSQENLFTLSAPALTLGLAVCGAALIRCLQAGSTHAFWRAMAWLLAIVWSAVVFHGFRDLGTIYSPVVDHFPSIVAIALLAFMGGFCVLRSSLRPETAAPFAFHPDFLSPWILASAAIACGLLLSFWGQSDEPNLDTRWRNILSPRSAEAGLKFDFTSASSPAIPANRIIGAADLSPVFIRNFFRGTRLDAPAFTGSLISDRFELTTPFLVVPIAGYPAAPGNALEIQIEDRYGKVLGHHVYTGPNPGGQFAFWPVDLTTETGAFARIRLTDGRKETDGWLAAAPPIRTGNANRAKILQRQMDWAPYVGAVPTLRWIVILGTSGFLIFLVCSLLHRVRPRRNLAP